MKEIKLLSMHLLNWRGAKDRTANFGNCTETNIIGDNGRGKSTFFDAFTWLLYGKDQFGRKDYKITPIENGVILNRLDSTVNAEIVVDGVLVNLKRTLHPKWTRKAGAKEQTFTGYETQFEIDGVPCRQKDYNAKVDEIIDATIFAMISDPHYFLKMKWKDQRDILFAIAGTVSDADLAAKDPNFAALLDRVSGKSMDEYRKKVAAEKKRLNEDLKVIPAKIDATRALMPEAPAEGWAVLEKQIADLDEEIKKYDAAIGSAVEKNNAEYNAQKKIFDQLNDLRRQRDEKIRQAHDAERQRVDNLNRQADADARKANAERDSLKADADAIRLKLDNINAEITHLADMESVENQKAAKAIAEKERLLTTWKEIKQRQFAAGSDCVMCPVFAGKVCQDPDAASHVAETNAKAKAAFDQKVADDLAEVNAAGKAKAEWIAKVQESAANYHKAIDENTAKANDLRKEFDVIMAKIENRPEVKAEHVSFVGISETAIPGVADLDQQIADLEKKTNEPAKAVNTADMQLEKHYFVVQRDNVVKQLAGRDQIEKGKAAIDALEEESKRLSQAIADIEKEEFLIADFVREKITECESRINGRFGRVDWKLFDYTLDGGEVETCYPLNKANGTPVDITNTADVLNCGIDIVNTLSEFYGISAPIFIDRRESVTTLIDTKAQIINLIVEKDKELTITNL